MNPHLPGQQAAHSVSTLLKDNPQLPMMEAYKKVAQSMKIDPKSVSNSFYRWKDRPEEGHGNQLFTASQEMVLLSFVVARSLSNQGMKRQELIELVAKLKNKPIKWRGASWYSGFVGRHKAVIQERKTKTMDKNKTSSELKISIQDWIPKITEFLQQHPTLNRWIFNADESPIKIGMDNLMTGILEVNDKERPSRVMQKLGRHVSILPFVNTKGETWLVVYLLSGEASTDEGGQEAVNVTLPSPTYGHPKPGSFSRIYVPTPHGFINSSAWYSILEHFSRVIKPHRGSEEVIIFLDNASPHRDTKTMKFLLEQRIHLVFLPAGSTHLIQPLDDQVFAGWRQSLNGAAGRQYRVNRPGAGPMIQTLLALSLKVEAGAFKPEVITGAWEKTGLWPWNEEKILGRLEGSVSDTLQSMPSAKREDFETMTTLFMEHLERTITPATPTNKLHLLLNKAYTSEDIMDDLGKVEAAKLEKLKQSAKKSAERKEQAMLKRQEKEKRKKEKERKDAEKRKARTAAKRRREQAKIESSCRLCPRKWRNQKKWKQCDKCTWSVCFTCYRDKDGKAKLGEHEVNCCVGQSKKPRRILQQEF